MCYRNKAIIEDRLLLGFKWDITTIKDKLWMSELSIWQDFTTSNPKSCNFIKLHEVYNL